MFIHPTARTASLALGKIQKSLGARMTLEIELKYDFSKVIAQIPLLPCVLFGKNLFSTPNLLWSKVIAIYWVYI